LFVCLFVTAFAHRYRHSDFTCLLNQYFQYKFYNYYLFQNRLLESLAKFQEYEDTLESIMRNLDDFEPVINEEVETPVNLKLAQQQLETARVRLLPHCFASQLQVAPSLGIRNASLL
jgi:hypothetical protein